jgi:hypothetical protein
MNLQPSRSVLYNDRRALFSNELDYGGHGQIPLTGAGTYVPSNSAYVFYKFNFLTSTTVSSVGFRVVTDPEGQVSYAANPASYVNFVFPALSTWTSPVTSLTITGGTGIAYEYKLYDPTTIMKEIIA